MKIDLNDDQLNEVSKTMIENLTKQNKSLIRKIEKLERNIQRLQQGMDCTKETRERIQELASSLADTIITADWSYYNYE